MSKKCKISIKEIIIIIDLKETETAKKIWNVLPIKSKIKTWGKEIYFCCDVQTSLEKNSKSVIEYGEIAFWPSGNCIAIGYGKTPISIEDEIRLADQCNIWGKTKADLNELEFCVEGTKILVEKIDE